MTIEELQKLDGNNNVKGRVCTIKEEIGLHKKEVRLQRHNKEWKYIFQNEKQKLEELLKGIKIQIEHTGSTAIPNIMAKPVIDMAIGVYNKEDIYKVIKILEKANYYIIDHMEEKGNFLVCVEAGPNVWTHQIHIGVIGSLCWNEDIKFRDYLLANPDKAVEYEKLKINLAGHYQNDRKSYTQGKNEFIKNILNTIKNKER